MCVGKRSIKLCVFVFLSGVFQSDQIINQDLRDGRAVALLQIILQGDQIRFQYVFFCHFFYSALFVCGVRFFVFHKVIIVFLYVNY